MVECAGLEIRCTVIPYRGFESHPFRQGIKHLGQPRAGLFASWLTPLCADFRPAQARHLPILPTAAASRSKATSAIEALRLGRIAQSGP